MTIAHVRRTDAVYPAVHTSDASWQDDIRPWLTDILEDEQQLGDAMAEIRKAVDDQDHKPWLLRTPQGISFITPVVMAAEFEDIAATDVLDEVWAERASHQGRGYSAAHDDVHGLGHIIREAVSHLHGFGETPTDQDIRGELIVAISLLVAGVDLIDRGESKVRTPLPTFYDHEAMQRYENTWIKKIDTYLANLQDLAGQAQDEEDSSTPEEAIGWAEAQFKATFAITDNKE